MKINKTKAIILSRYFNPTNKGQMEYFNDVKGLADEVICNWG